jgi:hypothetical protein
MAPPQPNWKEKEKPEGETPVTTEGKTPETNGGKE